MSARNTATLLIVLASFAATIAVGAALTGGQAHTRLTLSDVLIPAAIPVLLVIGLTIACRER